MNLGLTGRLPVAWFGTFLVAIALWCVPSSSAITAPEGWEEIHEAGVVLRFRSPDRAGARVLLPALSSGVRDVAGRLGSGKIEVTVYLAASEADFRTLSGGRIPHWGAGCAFPAEGTILLKRLPGRQDELLQTARHELAHIVLHQRTGGRVPVWFSEGVSMWIAREWRLGDSAEVFAAVIGGGLVPLSEIDGVLGFASSRAQLAYTESLLALVYLIGLGGPDSVRDLVDLVAANVPFDVALHRLTGLTPTAFEAAWSEHVIQRYSLVGMLTSSQMLWFYMAALMLLAVVVVRLRNRSRVRGWEEEEALSALPPRLRLQVRRREDRS
jgi:hypothetical protein